MYQQLMNNLQQSGHDSKKNPGSKLTGRGHIYYILTEARGKNIAY